MEMALMKGTKYWTDNIYLTRMLYNFETEQDNCLWMSQKEAQIIHKIKGWCNDSDMWVPGALSLGQSSWGIKLTTRLHLVPRSRMCGDTSTPQYAFMAWCSVKAQGQLYLYLYHGLCQQWGENG